MKTFLGRRGSGKTSMAIEEAYKSGAAIIEPTRQVALYVRERCKKHIKEVLGPDDADIQVLCVDDLFRGGYTGDVIVDEAVWVLREIIRGINPRLNLVFATVDADSEVHDTIRSSKTEEKGEKK